MKPLVLLTILSIIGSVAGLIGGVILLFKERWAKALASIAVPLAAGVLLTISLLDLFPESIKKIGDSTFVIVLVVFVLLFFIERFFFFFHHHLESEVRNEGRVDTRSAIPMVIFGDTIHNFLDGVAIGTSFLINPNLGLIVALSTFLHETPHEVADFGILLSNGWKRKTTFFTNFLSALSTFPGAFLAYLYADKLKSGSGVLLATATGFFLYVATTDFLPEAQHAPVKYSIRQAIFFVLGILAIVIIRYFFPEISH